MDSTILERPPTGLWPTLAESPCWGPLLEWLRLGGGLCVVTTAAKRSITQVWDCVPPELRANRALVLSALEGGDLVYGDEAGEMRTDEAYQRTGGATGGPTCFSSGPLDSILTYAEAMVRAIFADMQRDRAILAALTTKYHAPVEAVLERLAAGEAPEVQLSRQRLTEAGAIMTATGERIISFNTPLMAEPTTGDGGRVCTVSVMGFPAAYSKRYYEPLVEKAAALGADLSAAPNSLWFTPSGVSKATPIDWLQRHSDAYGFDLGNAVAFGDCPHSNDGPLTRLGVHSGTCGEGPLGSASPPAYCPFVSVADAHNAGCLPDHVRDSHVGGLEHGTALVLQGLLDAVRERLGLSSEEPARGDVSLPALLPGVLRRCREAASLEGRCA